MPRLYISTADFALHTAALTFPTQMAQVQANSGGLDQLLSRASRRVDGYCRKRVQAPGTTTVASPGISAGATALPVASTLGFDNGQEEAVVIGTGGTQETIAVAPGGVHVTSWTSPYPGVITLSAGVAFNHSAGEAVAGCYQEVSTVGSSDSSDVYSDSLIALNQAAQLAAAHAPQFDTSNLTRVIFLKCYPITSLLKIEHMLPIDTMYSTLFPGTTVGVQPAAGYLRLPIGSFVLPEGLIRTTYTAGFANVPEEIATATAWYAADELQTMKSMGAYDSMTGKQRFRWGQPMQGKSLYVQRAESAIDESGLKRLT